MKIEDWNNLIWAQLAAINSAPVPFTACLAVAALGSWKLSAWRYEGIIENLEHRLKLRDDTIAHMQPLDKPAPQASAPVFKEPSPARRSSAAAEKGERQRSASINELFEMMKNRTELQAKKVFADRIGNRLTVAGIVYAVSPLMDGVSISINPDGFDRGSVWMLFPQDHERLALLRHGDWIEADGEINSLEDAHISLINTQLLRMA